MPMRGVVGLTIDALTRLQKSLVDHEGVNYKPYLDHLGNWTVGVGHLIHDEEVEFHKAMEWVTLGVPVEQVEDWFAEDIATAIGAARNFLSPIIVGNLNYFDRLSSQRQIVLVEMAFQMGERNLNTFQRFREALRHHQYGRAAKEMLDSKWAREQTPDRAKELARRMREDSW